MMYRLILAALLAVALIVPAQAKKITSFQIGAWLGGAFTDDDTGRFNSCLATAEYNSGITMFVRIDRELLWEIGFLSNSWSFSKGEKIKLRFRIDRSNWENVVATAYSKNGVRIAMDGRAQLVKRFRGGRVFELQDSAETFRFDLTGTSRLMVALARCTEQQLAREPAAPADRNEVARNQTPAPQTQTTDQAPQTNQRATARQGTKQHARTTPQPEQSPAQVTDHMLVAEGTRILSNFISKANLSEPEILPPEDVPASLRFAHSVASAGGQIAFVLIVPHAADLPQKTVTAAIVARISDGCEGSFLSGSAKSEVDGTKLPTGFAACDEDDQLTQLRYVVTPRGDDGIYLIGLLAGSETVSSNGLLEAPPPDVVEDEALHLAAYQASR